MILRFLARNRLADGGPIARDGEAGVEGGWHLIGGQLSSGPARDQGWEGEP